MSGGQPRVVDERLTAMVQKSLPTGSGRPADAGAALIAVGARFAELIIERIDKVPERDRLAFLNLLGLTPEPPRPARVPLTLAPAEGAPAGVLVPGRTQARAGEAVFETEDDLVLTRARLVAVHVMGPDDRYSDRSAEATSGDSPALDAFTGDRPVPHELYIGCDEILAAPGTKTVTVRLDGPDLGPATWSRWTGAEWQQLPKRVDGHSPATIADLPALTPSVMNGVTAAWLRLVPDRLPPAPGQVESITLERSLVAGEVPVPAALLNGRPLDVTKDFHPFGEQPRFNDTFHVAVPPELALPGNEITLGVELTTNGVKEVEGTPKTMWEAWNGVTWKDVTPAESLITGATVRLTLPAAFAPTSISGQLRHWVRARLLVDHGYGEPARYKLADGSTSSPNADSAEPDTRSEVALDGPTTPSAQGGEYILVPDTFTPPVVKRMVWTHTSSVPVPAAACATVNGFASRTVWTDARTATAFEPFVTATESPGLYLGFDRPLDPQLVTLFLAVEPRRAEDLARGPGGQPIADDAVLDWEYCGAAGWQALAVDDDTGRLTDRGTVRFVGPPEQVSHACFGRRAYWLRVRHVSGRFGARRRLRWVQPNTVWAEHAITVANEVLGAGNGTANQSLRTAQRPVLPGQRVVVREEAHGDIWVDWHEVDDFVASGPLDRHYTLDPISGTIGFGDGNAGRLLPRGSKNVRITYRTGGGAGGNRPAGSITQLGTAIPFVDGVGQLDPAQGGADQESLDRLAVRGPATLRHRGFAVTAQDVEDLALAASTEVIRARALSGPPGHTTVVVVPDAHVARPVPSPGLCRLVAEHLRARCPSTARVEVIGPEWVEVAATVEVVAPPTAAPTVAARVRAVLDGYLHPLDGGPNGTGWEFGRRPRESDLYAAVRRVPGVDHVAALSLRRTPLAVPPDTGTRAVVAALESPMSVPEWAFPPRVRTWLDRALVCAGPHVVTVVLPGAVRG